MAAGFNQAAQAAFNLVKRKGAEIFNSPPPAAPNSSSAPDPLSMAEAMRMKSLAHTRELMARRRK